MALQAINFKRGEQMRHFTHPQHTLTLVTLPNLFTCHGCKEQGTGARYRCNECNIAIHEFCAKAPASMAHPYHTRHPLIFYNKPGTGFAKSKCDVCGQSFKGFAYRCNVCNFNIHSCCAELPQELNFYGHPQHALKLFSGSPGAKGSSNTCGGCCRKGSSWVYYCAKCGYYLDTVCAKTAINGLFAKGNLTPGRQSRFKRAVHFAMEVGQVFAGSLVESLGEAVAGVILDSATRDFNPHGGHDNCTDHHGDNGH